MFIEVKNLNIKYLYGAHAVKDLSFALEKGQKLAVLSYNEGGKTSLIKCISGLIPKESGEILVDGIDISKSSIKNRDFVTVYENEGVFSFKTVRSQLAYPLKLRKFDSKKINEKIENVSKTINISPVLHLLGRQLEDDDKVRLSFARILIRDTNLCLIDNPFNVLKGPDRQALFKEILPVLKDDKKTIIFTTNLINEAFTVGDKVLILNYGITEQYDTPFNIINNPKTLFVEKLVNPYSKITEENDIITSTTFIEEESGESAKAKDYFFENGNFYALLINGASIKINPPFKTDYTVKAVKINSFDKKTELNLNYIN